MTSYNKYVMPILTNLLYLITAGTLLSSCLLKNDSLKNNILYGGHFNTSHFAILPYDSTYHWLFSDAKPAQLNAFEQSKLGSLLKAAVSQYNTKVENTEFLIRNPDSYYFQTVSVLNAKGQKEVWVNAFCKLPSENWKQDLIIVQDGGSCYFSLKINLFKSVVYDMIVNGEA